MGWDHFLYEQERRKDLLRQVEQWQLIQQALKAQPRREGPARRALVWLGQHFVTWGAALQARYGEVEPMPARLESNDAVSC